MSFAPSAFSFPKALFNLGYRNSQYWESVNKILQSSFHALVAEESMVQRSVARGRIKPILTFPLHRTRHRHLHMHRNVLKEFLPLFLFLYLFQLSVDAPATRPPRRSSILFFLLLSIIDGFIAGLHYTSENLASCLIDPVTSSLFFSLFPLFSLSLSSQVHDLLSFFSFAFNPARSYSSTRLLLTIFSIPGSRTFSRVEKLSLTLRRSRSVQKQV